MSRIVGRASLSARGKWSRGWRLPGWWPVKGCLKARGWRRTTAGRRWMRLGRGWRMREDVKVPAGGHEGMPAQSNFNARRVHGPGVERAFRLATLHHLQDSHKTAMDEATMAGRTTQRRMTRCILQAAHQKWDHSSAGKVPCGVVSRAQGTAVWCMADGSVAEWAQTGREERCGKDGPSWGGRLAAVARQGDDGDHLPRGRSGRPSADSTARGRRSSRALAIELLARTVAIAWPSSRIRMISPLASTERGADSARPSLHTKGVPKKPVLGG